MITAPNRPICGEDGSMPLYITQQCDTTFDVGLCIATTLLYVCVLVCACVFCGCVSEDTYPIILSVC